MGEVLSEKFVMALNNSYETGGSFIPKVSGNDGPKKTDYNRCINTSIVISFICMTILMLGASVFFAHKINEVKSEAASLVNASSDFNASLHMLFLQVSKTPPLDSALTLFHNLSNFSTNK